VSLDYSLSSISTCKARTQEVCISSFNVTKQFVSSMEIIETDRITELDYYIKRPVDSTQLEVMVNIYLMGCPLDN
jgi:hypothetical protein